MHVVNRVQRKSQLAIRASSSKHALAQKSFQVARKIYLMNWIDYCQFFCNLNSLIVFTFPSGRLCCTVILSCLSVLKVVVVMISCLVPYCGASGELHDDAWT